ncbi:MAG: ferritin-like domain-containing protein [Pseudomonadota bacterium]
MENLHARAYACLMAAEVAEKIALTQHTAQDWRAGVLSLHDETSPIAVPVPGRPARPELVPPRGLKKRSIHTPHGYGALLHSIAHIEFNAINLAWDVVYRFRGLPKKYYDDWVRVAAEEAYHFGLLQARLQAFGFNYGDFPAHNGLWETAVETAHDLMLRMILVPRSLEARGLDVTPQIVEKIEAAGDTETVAVLAIILRDEITHVAAGTRWFNYLCAQRGVDPLQTFGEGILRLRGTVKGPFNHSARLAAGFSAQEMTLLENLPS